MVLSRGQVKFLKTSRTWLKEEWEPHRKKWERRRAAVRAWRHSFSWSPSLFTLSLKAWPLVWAKKSRMWSTWRLPSVFTKVPQAALSASRSSRPSLMTSDFVASSSRSFRLQLHSVWSSASHLQVLMISTRSFSTASPLALSSTSPPLRSLWKSSPFQAIATGSSLPSWSVQPSSLLCFSSSEKLL